MINELELVKNIKNIFKEKGGARYELKNEEGKICVFQAYMEALWTVDGESYYSSFSYWQELNQRSLEITGEGLIDVNNKLGEEEVLHILDVRIKELGENSL